MMAAVAVTAPRPTSLFLQGFLQARPVHDPILESTHGVGRGPRLGLPGGAELFRAHAGHFCTRTRPADRPLWGLSSATENCGLCCVQHSPWVLSGIDRASTPRLTCPSHSSRERRGRPRPGAHLESTRGSRTRHSILRSDACVAGPADQVAEPVVVTTLTLLLGHGGRSSTG